MLSDVASLNVRGGVWSLPKVDVMLEGCYNEETHLTKSQKGSRPPPPLLFMFNTSVFQILYQSSSIHRLSCIRCATSARETQNIRFRSRSSLSRVEIIILLACVLLAAKTWSWRTVTRPSVVNIIVTNSKLAARSVWSDRVHAMMQTDISDFIIS